jgi:hypothetical protein
MIKVWSLGIKATISLLTLSMGFSPLLYVIRDTNTLAQTPATDYTILQPKPSKASINQGLTSPSPTYMKSELDVPVQLSDDCPRTRSADLKKLIVTDSVGLFRVTGLKPEVAAIQSIFEKVKQENPDLYQQLGTGRMICVRKVREGSDFSNHAWGTAIDIKINGKLDSRGDNQTQAGLSELYHYFYAEKFYLGGAFPTEDSMRFEASQELVEYWKKSGLISQTQVSCQATVDKVLQEIRAKGVRRVYIYRLSKGTANEGRTGNPTNRTDELSIALSSSNETYTNSDKKSENIVSNILTSTILMKNWADRIVSNCSNTAIVSIGQDQSDYVMSYYIQSDGKTKLMECLPYMNISPSIVPWGKGFCL